MKLTLTGIKFRDSSIEYAFQKKQQEGRVRANQLAFLTEILSLASFLGVLLYFERLSTGNLIFFAFGVLYVILAYFLGERMKNLSQYLILLTEVWNVKIIEEIYKSTPDKENLVNIGIIKTSLTLICVSSTYNCFARFITFTAGTIYLSENLYGWGTNWDRQISWTTYILSTVLGFFFYFEERQVRLTFGKYYEEIENLKRWKFISEKFIPAGNVF